MHLYKGTIQKAKFYDARITHGVYEPLDSQLATITVSTTLNEHPWLKDRHYLSSSGIQMGAYNTGHELIWAKSDDLAKLGTHLVSFFTEKLKDFSLLKGDCVEALSHATDFFRRCHKNEQFLEMVDPATQYLEECY